MLLEDPVVHDRVWLDEGGLLHVGARWVPLPDTEWRLVDELFTHLGHLVPTADLCRAGWPDRPMREAPLHVTMTRMRKRLTPLGLTITTVRGRGFVLSTDEPVHS